MDCNEDEKSLTREGPLVSSVETYSGNSVTPTILNYYKKFGKKRDLEQYFSLSTAQSELRDLSSEFWRKMKSGNDSSDSGEKKSDSSQELCRISIKCSLPDPCSSQYHAKPKPILTGSALLESLGINIKPMDESSQTKESVSPPIITEEAQDDIQNSEEESVKSIDNSHKSFDVLDTSTNKPHSPSSSITSQRKLEWDSLADVGYANETDRKTSASSLSTLERLALKQQYSNNDTKLDSVLEPTAHSTPFDENETKSKKKGIGKKSTKIYKKEVDYLEVNVPHSSEHNPSQSINFNLTKHISFNVEKDGKVTFDNVQRNVNISPEKNAGIETTPTVKIDKELQTSLTKSRNISEPPKHIQIPSQKIPVLISLNTLRRQTRKKKLRMARKKLRSKKKVDNEVAADVVLEKSGEQLSEAESFEYMPGHMYHQNQLKVNERSGTTAGNKSSLESSGLLTTDSTSKGSIHSFTKDLEKSIDILKAALQKGDADDKKLRKELIKKMCEKLVNTKYRDDESTSDYLSGLIYNSKKPRANQQNHTTSSTSDNSAHKQQRPKKSILRNEKFNAAIIASTSQSAPNLPVASNSDKLVSSNLTKILTSSNTESDLSNKEKSSSDNVFAKTSSQELYQKYLDALKREEAYKRHLKDKEMFLKQKLVCSDSAIKGRSDAKVNSRLNDLIKDLTRNNYNDGSGDASKLEGGPNSSRDYDKFMPLRSQRSHSVFTLSSGGNSDQNKKQNLQKRLQSNLKDFAQPGTSKKHYCCCPHHSPRSKACGIDSSVQVNIRPCDDNTCEHRNVSAKETDSPKGVAKIVKDEATGEIRYVCLCNNKTIHDVPDNFMIFKCSQLARGNEGATSSKSSCHSRNASPRKESRNASIVQCSSSGSGKNSLDNVGAIKTTTKSSQTNFLLKMMRRKSSEHSGTSDGKTCSLKSDQFCNRNSVRDNKVYEATRSLQTEISINPKIPEPSLSDINIVTDCARLISEHCRILPKSSVTDIYDSEANSIEQKKNRSSRSSKSSGTSKEMGELLDDDTCSGSNRLPTNETKPVKNDTDSERSEKFTIPIQGTNMTLMVSIDAKEHKVVPDNNNISQCVGTEVDVTEQATSLTEDCSKGVQYNGPSPRNTTDYNRNNVEITKDRLKNHCVVNTCLIAEDPTFNTFPKTSPVNERKPFRRANTDTEFANKRVVPEIENKQQDKITKCAVQHIVNKKESVEKETQYSDKQSPKSSLPNQKITNTCEDTKERKTSLPDDNLCSCGCNGDKEKCSNKCIEVEKRTPTTCTVDNSNESSNNRKKSNLVDNYSGNTLCACGCCGNIENCKTDCEERKKTVSAQCSCGCAGDKMLCNKNCSELKKRQSKEIGTQKYLESPFNESPRDTKKTNSKSPEGNAKNDDCGMPGTSKNICDVECVDKQNKCISESETDKEIDPILEIIQNITKKYSKKDIEKSKRKKCFKEIMNVLNYLLETDDSTEQADEQVTSASSATPSARERTQTKSPILQKKTSQKSKTKPCITESSDCPQSTDIPGTSSDSATCKVLNKIKKECERYHQKRCKIHSGKKCEISSSTSANCDQCRRVHCSCRNHKCKAHKKTEKFQKKAVAYNLILQASESISEETVCKEKRQLQNIVVKVPKKNSCNVPFKEMCAKIESRMPQCSPREAKGPCRSRSLPNESEISSMEEFIRKSQACCTVREYLEHNRPDFIAKSSQRQNCLRIVNDSRANMRAAQRELLSVRLAHLSDVNDLDSDEVRQLARDLGRHMRQKRPAPKFISEREMKKHSEDIYKSLPEVMQKKEEVRRENIKKTNLLMANIFKKNLQKKTLRGSVDISNYSPIIKI